jgi:pimeloyl-ACP methyl ester carboxylesterase
MGETVSDVVDRAAAVLASRGSKLVVARRGVSYPANTWIYYRSRRLGVTSLMSHLIDAAGSSPNQRFVLVGLSQGAEVVRRVLARATTNVIERVVAVVVLGDPTRRPTDPWQHGTTDPQTGIAARHSVLIPPELHNRMWGYTLEGDEISANHVGMRGIFRSGAHTLYARNEDGVVDLAAGFIADQLESNSMDAEGSGPSSRGN